MTTQKVTLRVRLMPEYPAAKIPTYATDGSAAFDIYAAEPATLPARKAVVVATGVQLEIPPGYVMLVFSRSGHGFKYDVRLANCVGVIDSDFRGQLLVKITSDSSEGIPEWGYDSIQWFLVSPGDRIAQALLLPIPQVKFEQVQELTPTARGEGGLGSTGT